MNRTTRHMSGRSRARSLGVTSAILLSAAAGLSTANAAPLNSTPADDTSRGEIAVQETIPEGDAPYGNVPIEVYELATNIELEHPDVSFVWDNEAETMTVWYEANADGAKVESLVREAQLPQVSASEATYNFGDLEQLATDIVEAGALGNSEVTWAGARPDGSGLDVGVNSTAARASGATATPEPSEYAGVPVAIIDDGEAELASRDFGGTPYRAGADMIRSVGNGMGVTCSTAFAFNHLDLATRVITEQMFTADHCGSAGDVWFSGKSIANPSVGTTVSVVTEQRDLIAMSGADYGPYMYYGPNTSYNSVAIYGYVTPIAGASVCYSGAPSGMVCGNVVTHTGLTTTYGGGLTYLGQTRTVQQAAIPSVGNGDSGGPVAIIDSTGHPYAVGVISGMANGGTECTGDPSNASRKCSATVFFAPLQNYFAFNELDEIQVY